MLWLVLGPILVALGLARPDESNDRWRVAEIVTATATLEPLRAPVPFANIRDLHVTGAEDAFFIADEAVAELGRRPSVKHGIYLSHALSREVVCLVGPDTALPPLGRRPRFLRALRVDAGQFVFHAIDEAGGHGLYLWQQGELRPVVRTMTPAPDNGFWRSVGYGALAGEAVTFTAVEYPQRTGVFRFHVLTGETVRLLDAAGRGALADGAPALELFWQLPAVRDGRLALGGRVLAGGETVLVHPPLAAAITADRAAEEATGLRPLWNGADALPVPVGVEIDFVEQPAVGGAFVAFTAGRGGEPARGDYGGNFDRRDPAYEGVFLASPFGVLCLLDTTASIPGGAADGVRWAGFRSGLACDRGRVVFVAEGPGDLRTVLLYEAERDLLYTIATTAAPIDGFVAEDFELGPSPFVGDRVALTVRFVAGQERTHGVYLARPAREAPPAPVHWPQR